MSLKSVLKGIAVVAGFVSVLVIPIIAFDIVGGTLVGLAINTAIASFIFHTPEPKESATPHETTTNLMPIEPSGELHKEVPSGDSDFS